VGGMLHTYTEADVLANFPSIKLIAAKYQKMTHRPYRYGRYAIIEPVLLWRQWVQGASGTSGGQGGGDSGAGIHGTGKHGLRGSLGSGPGEGSLRSSLGSGLGEGSLRSGQSGRRGRESGHENGRSSLGFLWVIEQDVACSNAGRIAHDLIAAYNGDTSDLITALPINETKFAAKIRVQGSPGLHASIHTPAFADAFSPPGTSLRTASIFVQRWSPRFAAMLDDSMRNHGMHAWAEIATPSLCRRANMSITPLQPSHRGALFHACCTKHVKTTSRNFLPDEHKFAIRVNQSVAKLYHPVKF